MMRKSTYQAVEFVAHDRNLSTLKNWYELLPDSTVKTSIFQIRCEERHANYKISLRLIVLCGHPTFANSCELRTFAGSPPHASNTIPSFQDWIDQNDMPEEVRLGNQSAQIEWWPRGVMPHFFSDISYPAHRGFATSLPSFAVLPTAIMSRLIEPVISSGKTWWTSAGSSRTRSSS